MKISCPECHSLQKIKKNQSSQTILCKSCGISFLIPVNIRTEIRYLKHSFRKEKKQLKDELHKNQKGLVEEYQKRGKNLAKKSKEKLLRYNDQADPQSVGKVKVGITDSISLILLRTVFGLYCIITIGLTFFHMIVEYKTTEDGIRNDLVSIQEGFSLSLSTSLWYVNSEQLDAAVKGILQMPATTGVKILGPEGDELMSSGLILDENQEIREVSYDQNGEKQIKASNQLLSMIEFESPIIFENQGKQDSLGTITVYSHSGVIFDKVGYVLISIIFIAILKTLALWGIFLWISHHLLTKPLNQLTHETTRFNLNNLDVPTINIQSKGRNELKVLEESFHEMWMKLAEERKQNNEMTSTFEKFVPKQFLAKMMKGGRDMIPLGALEKNYQTTILFSELHLQTPITSLGSEEMFQLLNAYVGSMEDSIASNGGGISSLIGPTLVASFDLDTPASEAMHSIYATIGMQRKILHFYDDYPNYDFSETTLGSGIHHGDLKIGTVGNNSRMDINLMGEAVEVSKDLAELTRFYQCSILISENVFRSLPKEHPFYCRKLDQVYFETHRRTVEIYEIYNTDSEEIQNKKEASKKKFEEGVNAFHQQKWEKAQQLFSQSLQDFPEDPVGKEYLKRIEQCRSSSSFNNQEINVTFQSKSKMSLQPLKEK